MARYWRGEITLRKLRVLTQGLPPVGPHSRHTAEGREYSLTDALLWSVLWALQSNTVVTAQAAGAKKAKMPADEMPEYPWSRPEKKGQLVGDLGDFDQEEVLDFLDNL